MWSQKPSFRFEVDNFSEKEVVTSQTFLSGGCEWRVQVYPKGDDLCGNHVSLFLIVANRKSLPSGWKKSIEYYFVMLNQSDKELYRSRILGQSHDFCAEHPAWGLQKTLPLSMAQEKGCPEEDRLIIEVYINVLEAVDGKGEDVSKKEKTVDINGFQVSADGSRLQQLEERVKNLEEVFLESKKADGSRVQELEERVNSLEEVSLERKIIQQHEERINRLEEVSLERKIIIQQQEERIKSLEIMISDLKVGLEKEKTESCADGFLLVDEVD